MPEISPPRQAARLAALACELTRFFQGLACDDHLGAVALGVLDLHHRRADRHDDRCGSPEPLGVIGHAQGMIAGGHRDDAAPTLFGRQRAEPVQGATLLEGRGKLKIFEFEPDVAAAYLAERPAVIELRRDHRAADGRSRRDNVGRRDRNPVHIKCSDLFARRRLFGSFRHDRSYRPRHDSDSHYRFAS
jgi:hypothetical protein